MAPVSGGKQTNGFEGPLPNCSSISLGIMSPRWGRPLLLNGRERGTEGVERQASLHGGAWSWRARTNQLKKTPDLLLEPLFLISPASLLLLLSPQGPGWKEDKVLHSREENSALRPRAQVMRMRRREMAAMETFILLAGETFILLVGRCRRGRADLVGTSEAPGLKRC